MHEEPLPQPIPEDFHGQKRELLRRGVREGKLSWSEILAALPASFLTDVELEVFVFTCKNLGVEIVGSQP